VHSVKPPLADEGRVVLFDNVCNLCSGSVQFILRFNKDNSIKFASMQSALGHQVLVFYGFNTDSYESMIYIEDGLVLTKSAAAARIAKRLSFPWNLLQFLLVLPIGARDWLYDRIANNRYTLFGKRAECYLPDKEVYSRFLDL